MGTDSLPSWFVLLALTGIVGGAAGCSCGAALTDGSADGALDAAADAEVPPLDARSSPDASVFVPTDGGALTPEPCAERLQLTTVAWPDPLLALASTSGRLYGHGDSLAVSWQTGDSFDPATQIAWASYSAVTGAIDAHRAFRLDAPGFASPVAIGGAPAGLRLYLFTRDEPRRIGTVDVTADGEAPFRALDGIEPADLNGVVAGASIAVTSYSPRDGSPQQIVRLGSEARRYPLSAGLEVGGMLLSDDESTVVFAAQEAGSLRQMIGLLDLETASTRLREVPRERFPGEPRGLIPVLFGPEGPSIVAALSDREGRIELTYLWIDDAAAVVGSWTAPVTFRGLPPRIAPAVRHGDAVLLAYTGELGGRYPLYAGVSSGPGVVAGAARPVAVLPSQPWHLRAWSSGAFAS